MCAGAYDAQELVNRHKAEIGIEILDFKALSYVQSLDAYVPEEKVPQGETPLSISGTKFRAMMASGEAIPQWFSHPDVIKILRVSGGHTQEPYSRMCMVWGVIARACV